MWDFVNKVWIKKGKKYGYCKNPGGLCGNLQSKENCKFSEDLNTQRNARVVHIKKWKKVAVNGLFTKLSTISTGWERNFCG